MPLPSVRFRVGAAVIALLAAFLCARAGFAQASVYATATLTNYGFTNLYSNSNDISFKGDSGGLAGGAFFDFPIHSRFKAGIDARLGGSFGSKGGVLGCVSFRVRSSPQSAPAVRPDWRRYRAFQLQPDHIHLSRWSLQLYDL